MADLKISQLGSITVLTPATDVLPVVDVTGTTKKITTNQILGSGGTATLASATITGDLTVDTNVLKVDTTLNRVGIGTATPVSSLQVLDGDITVTTGGSFSGFNGTRQTVPSSVGTQLSRLHFSAYSTGTTYVQGASIQSYSDAAWSASSAPAYLAFYTTPSASVTLSERYRIASDGVATWSNVGGVAGTAMTLNSTGLGVGMSPSAILSVLKSSATQATGLILRNASGADGCSISLDFEASAGTSGSEGSLAGRISGRRVGGGTTGALDFFVNNAGTLGTAKMTIDSSGNVGVGVTPSAWQTGTPAVQLKYNSSIWSNSDNTIQINQNAYFDGSSWKYVNATSLQASNYFQYNGSHIWRTAGAGTAGNAITWTTPMTLDASGNLLVGTTTMPSGVTLARLVAKSDLSDWSGVIWNSNAIPYGFRIQHDTDSNGTGNEFLYCLGAANLRASIRSNGGIANYQANDVSLSDSRMKSDIKPLGSYWNKIKSLEIVTFKYKDQTHNDDNIGLIAQQVESVAPEFVDVDGFGNTPDDGVPLKTIYTTDLYHAAIKALQEAMTRIEVLESKLA